MSNAAAASSGTPDSPITFSFGQNWERFVAEVLDEERIEIARQQLLSFLEVEDLQGLSVIDAGSGSGIHSLAMIRSGVSRLTSFDVDPASVRATTSLREKLGSPGAWTVREGSVLDLDFVSSLDTVDLVYSWGVLHHTGSMWEAIRNASSRVAPGGRFLIGIYATDDASDYWLMRKQQYNRSSPRGKRLLELWYAWRYTIRPALRRRENPLRVIRAHKSRRGMSYWTDVRDWLGGLPYEHARPEEVLRFVTRELGFEFRNMTTHESVHEYLFRRPE